MPLSTPQRRMLTFGGTHDVFEGQTAKRGQSRGFGQEKEEGLDLDGSRESDEKWWWHNNG
ncbi:MAG: hypothetical protein LQ340_004307, partial [Diploschistes diacapsis]